MQMGEFLLLILCLSVIVINFTGEEKEKVFLGTCNCTTGINYRLHFFRTHNQG